MEHKRQKIKPASEDVIGSWQAGVARIRGQSLLSRDGGKKPRRKVRVTNLQLSRTLLVLAPIAICTFAFGWLAVRAWLANQDAPYIPPSPEITPIANSQAPAEPITATPTEVIEVVPETKPVVESGALLLSVRWEGRDRILAYWPDEREGSFLATGSWDDRDAVASPDGSTIAFSSHRDGQWDLYLLQLASANIERLTDTPGYDGHPTWSPDGRRLAYEAYSDKDFDIWILEINGGGSPTQLTTEPSNETSPAWDPTGDRIAFVSDREGESDIFLATLEEGAASFQNLTHSPQVSERAPAFHPNGTQLVYSTTMAGLDLILIDDLNLSNETVVEIGQGSEPAWSPDGHTIAAILRYPLGTHLVAYSVDASGSHTLGQPQPSRLSSLSWSDVGSQLQESGLTEALASIQPLMGEQQASNPTSPRTNVVPLEGVKAPDAVLSDCVDEAFNALRARAAEELGWDFLGNLENAYVGLNVPLAPGYSANDWLYTGRAFAFIEAALRAGWVEIVREDYGGQTYWRVFVRTMYQDGSLGEPMRDRPWDLSARYSIDPTSYELGGAPRPSVPFGYYLDFTELAADFGFERLPANQNWRTFYHGARFNEFVMTGGLTWEQAMLELYPASAIATPTPFMTPTPTLLPSD